MKTFNFFLALAVICVFPAQGQPFSSVTLGSSVQNEQVINFALPSESNVRYFRIEGSNDGTEYNVIGTLKSTGNSVLAKSYRYKLYDADYAYYRVGIVSMNASLQYSNIITIQKQVLPGTKTSPIAPGPAIVNNRK